jgi:hypothetical protein
MWKFIINNWKYLPKNIFFIYSTFKTWNKKSSSSSSAHLCPHCWGTGLPYGLPTRRTGSNPPRGPSAYWWVLTTANTAETNGLTCLPKHGGARDNTFLVTHPITDQRCLTFAIARRSALTAGPSKSSILFIINWTYLLKDIFASDSTFQTWNKS